MTPAHLPYLDMPHAAATVLSAHEAQPPFANGRRRIPLNAALAVRFLVGATLLFAAGSVVATLSSILMNQQNVTRYPPSLLSLFSTALWVPAVCGVSAVLVGLLYPAVDMLLLGQPHVTDENSWANITRCLVLFLGVTYAAAKLPFDDNVQLSVALAVMAVSMWYIFDRTTHGFAMGMLVAVGGTVASSLLTLSGALSFTRADLFGVRSWIPVLFFTAGVCFGSIGRKLAAELPTAPVASPPGKAKRD